MVNAFLAGRTMRFKVNGTLSNPRNVSGGSPQGTKLGNFLFIATINTIEDHNTLQELITPVIEAEDEDSYGLRRLAGRIGAVRRFNSGVVNASTPCKKATTDGVLRYIDVSGRENSTLLEDTPSLLTEPRCWPEVPPWLGKYVDDLNTGERLYLRNAISTFSHTKEKKLIRATECERAFAAVFDNATKIGMKVNPSKTQLLCLSSSNSCEVSSFVEHGGSRIGNVASMTLLGFGFDGRPSVHALVDLIRRKFNSRAWMIRHLKMSGVPDNDIVKVFCSVIRPVIEYVSSVYHPMLSLALSEEIESMQRRVLKIIFGFRTSYKTALEYAEIGTLANRRSASFEKFARNTAANERFRHWFPTLDRPRYNLRTKLIYEEFHANTQRLYQSPLYAMRRLLNMK